MAQRRMFSKKIVETDKFYLVSLEAQAIYNHLSMNADDDGFVSSPQMILRASGGTPEMLQELVAARYIIPFDSGIYLITDWFENNNIQKDRYKPSIYTRERSLVKLVGKTYYLKSDPQVRLEENR